MDLIIPSDLNKSQIIQINRSSELLKSNLQQLHEIETYRVQNPNLSMNEAAIQWIASNAKEWRTAHPLNLSI